MEIFLWYAGKAEKSRLPILWAVPCKVPMEAWDADGRKTNGGNNMSVISMKQLLEAGVPYGHQTRRLTPKMAT